MGRNAVDACRRRNGSRLPDPLRLAGFLPSRTDRVVQFIRQRARFEQRRRGHAGGVVEAVRGPRCTHPSDLQRNHEDLLVPTCSNPNTSPPTDIHDSKASLIWGRPDNRTGRWRPSMAKRLFGPANHANCTAQIRQARGSCHAVAPEANSFAPHLHPLQHGAWTRTAPGDSGPINTSRARDRPRSGGTPDHSAPAHSRPRDTSMRPPGTG